MRKRQKVERGYADHDIDCKCSNCENARCCEPVIKTFANQRGPASANGVNNTIADLICCLGHYCEAHRLDFIMIVQRGVGAWRAEMEGPDELGTAFTAKLSITPRRVL